MVVPKSGQSDRSLKINYDSSNKYTKRQAASIFERAVQCSSLKLDVCIFTKYVYRLQGPWVKWVESVSYAGSGTE
jgi:hypothetical protein